jgi:hypothetical protein
MVWRFDADFGWYDDADPLGNVPTGPSVIPGTDVQRNIGGTYHPDVVMPDPIITMANAAALGPAIAAGGGASNATNSFLAALNAAQTGQPVQAVQPVSSVDIPTDKEGDEQIRNGVPYIYTGGAWQPKPVATPQTGQIPWDTFPAGSDREILGKMNQNFYTTDSSGDYNSLTRFYNDAAAYLTSQKVEVNDQNVYATMQHLAEQAAEQAGGTVAGKYLWYDKNITDWIYEGRPLRPNGPAQAAVYGDAIGILKSLNDGTVIRTSDLDKITDPATKASAVTLLTNNILRTLGNTADGTSGLGQIYNKYIDVEGGDPAVR